MHCLQELLKTQTALRNLIKRNRDLPVEVLAARNKEAHKGPTALQLPFILIQVSFFISCNGRQLREFSMSAGGPLIWCCNTLYLSFAGKQVLLHPIARPCLMLSDQTYHHSTPFEVACLRVLARGCAAMNLYRFGATSSI